MKKRNSLVFCFAVLFLTSWAFASFPSRGTCEILENPGELPAYCEGEVLVIKEEVNDFKVLGVPEGVDINTFIGNQIALNSVQQEINDEDWFWIPFYTGKGIYRLEINGKEIVVEFKAAESTYDLRNLIIALSAGVALVVVSLAMMFFRNKIQKKILLMLCLLWLILFFTFLIFINPQ